MHSNGQNGSDHGSSYAWRPPSHDQSEHSGKGTATHDHEMIAVRQDWLETGHPTLWPGPTGHPDSAAYHTFNLAPPHHAATHTRISDGRPASGFQTDHLLPHGFHPAPRQADHQQPAWDTGGSHTNHPMTQPLASHDNEGIHHARHPRTQSTDSFARAAPQRGVLSPTTSPSAPIPPPAGSQSTLSGLPYGQPSIWGSGPALESREYTAIDAMSFGFGSSAHEMSGSGPSTSDLQSPSTDAHIQQEYYRPYTASSDTALDTHSTSPRPHRTSLSDTLSPVEDEAEARAEAPGRSRLDKRRNQNKLAQRAFRARTKTQQSEINNQIVELIKTNESQAKRLEEMTHMISTLQQENMNLKVAAINASLPDGEKIVSPGSSSRPPDTGG